VSADAEVTIVGRVFRLGGVYAPRSDGYFRKPHRLRDLDPDSPLPGGRVTAEIVPAGVPRAMAGTGWAARAGGEVPS